MGLAVVIVKHKRSGWVAEQVDRELSIRTNEWKARQLVLVPEIELATRFGDMNEARANVGVSFVNEGPFAWDDFEFFMLRRF